jgi:hypothetical protein
MSHPAFQEPWAVAFALGLAAMAGCAQNSASRGGPSPDADPFQRTFQSKDEAIAAMREYEPKAPTAGDEAPDFTLRSPDGERTIRLSSFREKAPVVLVFGSYT